MTTPIKLDQFGCEAVFNCRGTIKGHRSGGERLLFLFGERHGIKPFVKLNLLNALDLHDLGVLSCVGVEGRPLDEGETFPADDVVREFQSQQGQHGGNAEMIIEGMLRWFQRSGFLFWNLLTLLRPSLPIRSVEDLGLYRRAEALNFQYGCVRRDAIVEALRRSDLFEPDHPHRECKIQEKANVQWEQEMSQEEVTRARDDQFIKAMLELWDATGGKVAVLNAGTAHQYRIARLLPDEISFYHIEQP